jgi:hypothetical protein
MIKRARASVLPLTAVAVISIASVAGANRGIRDNTINTRDIKDNQVNTKDLRNGSLTTRDVHDNQINTRDIRDDALRGADIHDGSIGLGELTPSAMSYAGTATLFDPRAHDQDSDGNGAVDNPTGTVPGQVCCLTWAQGPTEIAEDVPNSADPIPAVGDGRYWRSVVLEPGAYVLQATGSAQKSAGAATGVATRLFLGGKPLADGGGYAAYPASEGGLPVSTSRTTAFEVGQGSAADRQLVERVVSLDGDATFGDNLLIWEVTPR